MRTVFRTQSINSHLKNSVGAACAETEPCCAIMHAHLENMHMRVRGGRQLVQPLKKLQSVNSKINIAKLSPREVLSSSRHTNVSAGLSGTRFRIWSADNAPPGIAQVGVQAHHIYSHNSELFYLLYDLTSFQFRQRSSWAFAASLDTTRTHELATSRTPPRCLSRGD